MKKDLFLLVTVFSIIYIPLFFLFSFIVPDSSIDSQKKILNVIEKPSFIDQDAEKDSMISEYDKFNKKLSAAVDIVARENEVTENSILLLTCVVIFISLGIPLLLNHFESKREERIKLIIEENLNKKTEEKESYLTDKIMNKVQKELYDYRSLHERSLHDKLNDYSSFQERTLHDIRRDIMKKTELSNDKQSSEIRNELNEYTDNLVSYEMEKCKKKLDDNMSSMKNELSGMQDELYQHMKIEDTLSSRIRDRKAQAVLNHWLNAMYQLSDSSSTRALSLVLSRHIGFIFTLEQLCSTTQETIADALFNLESHADEVPKTDLLNLLSELKRQQRLNERDVFIPLRRLEIKLQGLGENELDA